MTGARSPSGSGMTRQPRTGTPLTRHRADEPLRLPDAGPVVDPPLVLDEQLDRAPRPGWQRQCTVVVVAGEHADGLAGRGRPAPGRGPPPTDSTAGPVTSTAAWYSVNPWTWPSSSALTGSSHECHAPSRVSTVHSGDAWENGDGERWARARRRAGRAARHRRVPGDDVTERPVLGGRVSGLVERRVVVIAGGDGRVRPLVVRPAGEPEVRARRGTCRCSPTPRRAAARPARAAASAAAVT